MNKIWLIFSAIVCLYCWYKYDTRKKKLLAKHPEIFTKSPKDRDLWEISAYEFHKSHRHSFAGIAATAIVVGIWGGVWVPYKANQEISRQYTAYISAFDKGWNDYCDDIFDFHLSSISPNGILYAGSQSFTSSWCKGLRNESDSIDSAQTDDIKGMARYSSIAYASEKGQGAGFRKSREKVFSMVPYLCYDTECISSDSEQERIINSNLQAWSLDRNFDY